MENQKVRFFKKGGSLEDWNDMLQGGLLPNHLTWVEAKSHDDVWAYAEATLGKGGVMEYECYDWNGGAQGKACLRVEGWGDAGRGYLVGDHLAASDGYCDWYGKRNLNDGKGLYHLCRDDRKKCKEKLHRGDRRELAHISRWRLVNVLMMAGMEYTKKLAMDAIMRFIDEWTPRVPEPAEPPKAKEQPEAVGDPTGLDRALEKAKEAAKKSGEEEIKEGEGKTESTRTPRGSVGALLEKKAAERREQQRKKLDDRRKASRGRSRSRRRRRGKKKRGKSSSEGRSGSGESRTSESS
ncbi:Uncharacterized protein SCF082_LOCUS6623 [Durusdinium trenchii]|uniref:Uncharacterized protein n=1 Tax=Durusdinium trenchii TaxID=1381693 RepID=A0ABP0IDQ0_9DINO